MATRNKEIYKKNKEGKLEFAGYLPTEDVPSRVDNVESSIKDIKDKYITKNEANSSFAGSTATKEALEGLNEATGNNANAISNIQSSLAKKQDKLTPGKGISINTTTNEISVNDGAFATTDYVMNNFVANSTYEQDKDDLDHDIGGLASRVTANESSISNLNNAVADRYTKAETDGKLDEKLSVITSVPKYRFEGNGKHRFCKIATITALLSWANRPIVFECIGRGMNSRQIISIYPTPTQAATETTFTNITKTTNDLYWALKDEGNGVGSLYVMLNEVWGNVQVLRVSYYAYVNVEMKMEECDGFPEGSIAAKNVITALSADTATTANTASLANSLSMPRDTSYNPDNYSNNSEAKVVAKETSQGASIGGLGYAWWHIFNNLSIDDRFSTQLALRLYDGIGSVEQTPYLAFRNHTTRGWSDWAVAISDKTIGQQTVKSFTATEVDHGCKFNGDVQSTSLVTSPMHVATSEFTVSADNNPNAKRTKQGNLEVTFGSVKKTIHMMYNPFMEYFFKHGYHFSAVKEGGDSTLYDRGIVTYGNFIYYCVYTYRSENDDDFAAAIIATDDTEDMSKYVMSQGGSASELQIIDNYFRTNDLKKVEIQEKAGTLALTTDIPSVPKLVDDLTTADASSTLSANQGYVLNNKIAAIKFSFSGTHASIGSIGPYNDLGDEDLDYSTKLESGTYGRFYVISGFETGGHGKNYGKLAIKTSAYAKKDMTTNMVAGVSGETGYWSPQWLSVSVIVPAGASYYLYGCRIKDVYFSYVELNH